jgi:hypothetical protein
MELNGQLQAYATLHFTRGEGAPDTHWKGGWVGLRAGLDTVEKKKLPMAGTESRFLGRPARNLSLYRLSCRGLQVIRR